MARSGWLKFSQQIWTNSHLECQMTGQTKQRFALEKSGIGRQRRGTFIWNINIIINIYFSLEHHVFGDKEGALHKFSASTKLKSLPKGGGLIHAENTLVDNSIFKTVWDGNACKTQCRETKTVSRTFSGFSSVGGPCCRLVLRRRCQDCPCLSTQSQILIFGPTATFKTDQQKKIKLRTNWRNILQNTPMHQSQLIGIEKTFRPKVREPSYYDADNSCPLGAEKTSKETKSDSGR